MQKRKVTAKRMIWSALVQATDYNNKFYRIIETVTTMHNIDSQRKRRIAVRRYNMFYITFHLCALA